METVVEPLICASLNGHGTNDGCVVHIADGRSTITFISSSDPITQDQDQLRGPLLTRLPSKVAVIVTSCLTRILFYFLRIRRQYYVLGERLIVGDLDSSPKEEHPIRTLALTLRPIPLFDHTVVNGGEGERRRSSFSHQLEL